MFFSKGRWFYEKFSKTYLLWYQFNPSEWIPWFLQKWEYVLFYKKQKNAAEGFSVYHDQPEGDYFEPGTTKLYEDGTSRNGNIKTWLSETAYELYRYHDRNFYAEPGFSTFHGYLVLAADGSGINIPTTKETLEEFGTSSRKGTKPQASIGLGCLDDVMNWMILESDCRKCKFDEMRLAEEQIDRVPETIGISRPFLVVMDRGYPSTPAFVWMMEKNIPFLVRLKSSDYKKEQAALSASETKPDSKHWNTEKWPNLYSVGKGCAETG